MAKDRKKLQHIHSSIPDKQPTAASLEVAEIAVNNAADKEFLSIKNTNDKVVRFSSDGQIIEWIERKEVMPYVGYVRGAAGPSATSGDTPTADGYGSYGIENTDLLNNKSELVFKLNQVAADLTAKHDKVNGKKDMYNKEVNPTTDGGINDGAGFFIDMSRYAMQDANPQFSSTTNTCRTTLSGTTIIRGLDGSCGSLLDIKVNSATAEVKTATTNVTSANTNISTATTVIGTASTNVNSAYTSANTATTIINTANTSATTATLSGNTLTVDENQTTVNSCGKVEINTDNFSLSQCSSSGGSAEFEFCNGYTVKSNDVKIQHCDGATSGSISIKEKTIEISGTTINEGGTTNNNTFTTVNNTATTINNSTTTYNITGTSNVNVYGGDVCISGGTDASLGAKTVKIGTDCGTNTIATGITINATTSVTVNAPTTIITGDTYLDGDLHLSDGKDIYLDIPCESISSDTVGDALCEVIGRGSVTMEVISGSATSEILKTYRLKQNGQQIGEDINIPKDHILRDASIVRGCLSNDGKTLNNCSTSCCHWYIKLVWNVFDPSTGHADDKTTYLLADDFIQDIEANNTKTTNRGATVDVWYNNTSGKMNVSADTTLNLSTAKDSSYKKENGQHYLSASTLTFSAGTFSEKTYNPFGNGQTISIPKSPSDIGMKDLEISTGNTYVSGGPYNGSSTAKIVVPSSIDNLTNYNNGKVTIEHPTDIGGKLYVDGSIETTSGLTKELRIMSGTTSYVPEPGLNYAKYNGSKNVSIAIPTCVNHLYRHKLEIQKNGTNVGTYDPGLDCTDSTDRINIDVPTCVNQLNRHKLIIQQNGTTLCEYDPGKDCSNSAETIDISVPTPPSCVSDLTRHTLKIQKNGVEIGTYDPGRDCTSSAETINIEVPAAVSCVNQLDRHTLIFQQNGVEIGTYDPGRDCGNSAETINIITSSPAPVHEHLYLNYGDASNVTTQGDYDTSATVNVTIPNSLKNISNSYVEDSSPTGSTGYITIKKDLKVSGTAESNGFFQTSDERKKDNIQSLSPLDIQKAGNVFLKSFTLKSDETNRKLYGVIAQEVENAGLEELVHTDEEGYKSVDYTSLLILKVARLENYCNILNGMIKELMNKLENKD